MIRKAPGADDSISSIVLALWRALLSQMLDSYRPELHYMRGLGPRWRAKHQLALASAGGGR